MTPRAATPSSLHAAFLPLRDGARLGAVLSDGLAVAQPLSLQLKLYGKGTSWPRSHARVCYRVQTSGKTQAQAPILHGWACLRDAPPPYAGEPAPRRVALENLDLHLWPLPYDNALPGLPALWALPRGPQPEVVSYRPGERAVLRYPRHDRTPEMYAKTFLNAQMACQVHARAHRIHAARAFDCMPALALDVDHAAVWSLGARGECLADTLRRGFDARIARRIVEALAALHGLSHDQLPRAHSHLLLEEADKKLDRLLRVHPQSGTLLVPLRKAIHLSPGAAREAHVVALHGDFHLRQWLRRGEDLTLLDFDEFMLGAAETDLASLCMDLALYGLTPADVAAWLNAFLEQYALAAPWGLHREVLQWHLRLQAVNKMHRALVQLHPDLAGQCVHFMTHLDAALAASES